MAYLSTTDFTQDKDFIDKWLYTIRTGEMDLSWMKSATEKISPEEANPRRGLTYRDLNVGTYGYTNIPEDVRTSQSMVSRGSEKIGNVRLPESFIVLGRLFRLAL